MDIVNIASEFYKRTDIQLAIANASKNREVSFRFGEKGFGKRPDVIRSAGDVLEMGKQGVSSFHVSEEIWKNPLNIKTGMSPRQLDEIRIGWDLVLDIDCPVWEISKLITHLLIRALYKHGVTSVSVKFSGNKGFHIGVPFQAFPTNVHGKNMAQLFPDAPRRIAEYLIHYVNSEKTDFEFSKEIKKRYTRDKLAELFEKPKSEFTDKNGNLKVDSILEVDTVLIASRHLYRMVYSLHEKSGLASVPFDPKNILNFDKKYARPEILTPSEYVFLDTTNTRPGEAATLLLESYDYKPKIEREEYKGEKTYTAFNLDEIEIEVPEELFPPCMQLILKGVKDGRKRSMFILINFLRSVRWSYEKIEERMALWNKENEEPLREVLIKGHIRYHKQNKKKVLPPNCDNKGYYLDFGVCKPDNLCAKIKNPVNYAKRKAYYLNEDHKKQKEKEEQKAFKEKQKLENKEANKKQKQEEKEFKKLQKEKRAQEEEIKD